MIFLMIKHKKYQTVDPEKHITWTWGPNGTGHYTQKEEMYLSHFKNMMDPFRGGNILEVGPGSGKFALMLSRNYNITNYSILDLDKNIKAAKAKLTNNNISSDFTVSQDYTNLFGRKFDLLVSNVCLSETPAYYREDLLANVLPTCNKVFIIDGEGLDLEFNDWLKNIIAKHFTEVQVTQTNYAKCFAICGTKIP